jgi:hypothetical protein
MEMEPSKMFNFKEELTSPTYFISFIIPIFEGKDLVPCNGDIWIPNVIRKKSHNTFFCSLDGGAHLHVG